MTLGVELIIETLHILIQTWRLLLEGVLLRIIRVILVEVRSSHRLWTLISGVASEIELTRLRHVRGVLEALALSPKVIEGVGDLLL